MNNRVRSKTRIQPSKVGTHNPTIYDLNKIITILSELQPYCIANDFKDYGCDPSRVKASLQWLRGKGIVEKSSGMNLQRSKSGSVYNKEVTVYYLTDSYKEFLSKKRGESQ